MHKGCFTQKKIQKKTQTKLEKLKNMLLPKQESKQRIQKILELHKGCFAQANFKTKSKPSLKYQKLCFYTDKIQNKHHIVSKLISHHLLAV
ncbi:hypothetical protein BBW65_01005 [Helicobacter enhydrae]|uniref:Uncharacterized protein n=1 Tax=Helicobacter enhydrae TaxID=222136 RepID=A0A1B1U400_9HELI|nr:hypothetical protein BBW65_01005 [Helicobacter enhydrae]